jgi:hypothetical protein
MADTPVITSSVFIATYTTADMFTLAPGLYAKLSPSHPFSAARGALQMRGWINAFEDRADMANGTHTNPNPLNGGGSKPEPQLTVWVYSTKDRRFSMSCDFVFTDWGQPTAFKVWMPDGTGQVFDANALGFEFTTTSSGWHKFGIAAVAPENKTCVYTFRECEVTYLGPSE